MRLASLGLHNFRNIKDSSFFIGEHLTVFIGDNAKGKTNCIEAVFFLVYGTGFRETREEELVLFGDKASAYVEGVFTDKSEKISCKVGLVRYELGYKKSFFINKAQKQLRQYKQEPRGVVLFAPEHIEMLTGSPNRRRSYFDKLISQFDHQYKKNLDVYERAVRRRNKILENFEDVEKLQDEILYWNEVCVQSAGFVTTARQNYCDFLNSNQSVDGKKFRVEYLRNEFNQAQIEKYKELELKTRRTMFGPQKDDFQIFLTQKPLHTSAVKKHHDTSKEPIHTSEVKKHNDTSDVNEENVQKYGSRSEQRLALMWLKLGEIRYFQEVSKFDPILLLDDVFSEFDSANKELILDLVKQYQTVASTTDMEIVNLAKKHKIPSKIINL